MPTITIEGAEELERKLSLLVGALNVRAILDESGAVLFNRIRKRFLDQEDADGRPWMPSRAAQRRATIGAGGGTLYDTGRLFQSLQLFAVGENSRNIGTNVPYAAKHNLGIGGMVKREFLGFGDEDASVVLRLIVKRITEALE